MNDIKEYGRQILIYLSDLRVKDDYQSLSDSEFYDIVGECLKLNSKFFMNSIYKDLRKIAKRQFGVKGRRFMEKNILERFCLYEGEQILYECEGKVQQTRKGKGVKIYGTLFVTNERIIAQGKIGDTGHTTGSGSIFDLLLVPSAISKSRKIRKTKDIVVERSVTQELPYYGYQFPYQNHFKLTIKPRKIKYKMTQDNLPYDLLVYSYSFKDKEQLDYLIEILSKKPGQLVDKKVFDVEGHPAKFGITALIFDLIALLLIIVLFRVPFSSLLATPFTIVGMISGYHGSNYGLMKDTKPGLAKVSGCLGGILFFATFFYLGTF